MTPLQSAYMKIASLEEKIEDLEYELKQARATAGFSPELELVLKFQGEWNLPDTPARMLAYLYKRKTLITKAQFMNLLYEHPDDAPEPKIIDVQVCKLRNKIGKTAIATHWGHGYQLTEQGREACDRVAAAEMKPRPPNANYGKVRFPKERGANA